MEGGVVQFCPLHALAPSYTEEVIRVHVFVTIVVLCLGSAKSALVFTFKGFADLIKHQSLRSLYIQRGMTTPQFHNFFLANILFLKEVERNPLNQNGKLVSDFCFVKDNRLKYCATNIIKYNTMQLKDNVSMCVVYVCVRHI